MRESHPDKGYDDEWCKKINEAYQKIVDYRNNVNGFDKNLCLVPKKFREMGFDNIPTVGQYVRKLIEMENNKKLKGDENVLENDILKLCRIVIVGGSEITKEIYNYLFDNNINAYISYGMTETASGIAGYFVKNSETFKKNYLGSPHSNVDLKIIHDKICIKSPTVMKGYHKGSNCNGSFAWCLCLIIFCKHLKLIIFHLVSYEVNISNIITLSYPTTLFFFFIL